MKVIFDGKLIDENADSTRGWLRGEGIFETLKTVQGQPYWLHRHIKRAQRSAIELGIFIPEADLIRESIEQLIAREPHPNGMLRLSFSSDGHWLVAHMPYQGVRSEAEVRIHPEAMSAPMQKRFPYRERLAILDSAKAAGFDDALVANEQGYLCEGSVTNLLVKIENRWVTPPVSDGVLPGIMRDILLENELVSVHSIALLEKAAITSAFLISSLRLAQPISAIDQQSLHLSHGMKQEIHALAVRYSVD